jgi:hypothetical protein
MSCSIKCLGYFVLTNQSDDCAPAQPPALGEGPSGQRAAAAAQAQQLERAPSGADAARGRSRERQQDGRVRRGPPAFPPQRGRQGQVCGSVVGSMAFT